MRPAREVMAHLAATGLTPEQAALVMELSASIAAEARPVVDEAAERRRARDREYQAARRRNRQMSADSADAPPSPDKSPPDPQKLTPTPHPPSPPKGGTSPLPVSADADPVEHELVEQAPPAPRQPVGEAVAAWNSVAAEVGWPTVRVVSPARSKAVSARLREHGLDGWMGAIARARASPFLAGSDPPAWFTFDWITKSGNFLKLIEGNYDRRNDGRDPASASFSRLLAAGLGYGVGAVEDAGAGGAWLDAGRGTA